MNAEIKQLFAEYLPDTKDPVAAAVLVLSDVLTRKPPEPIIVEPEDCRLYTVKEAAGRLNLSSKNVYQMCLAGQLRCVRISGRVRIPVEEIERYEDD